jgi:hypothetical protein
MVSPADLDPKAMAEYYDAEADVIGHLGRQAMKIAKKLGLDPNDARVKAEMRAASAEHLVELNLLAKLIAQAKRQLVRKLVRQWVATGEKVMIAAHHRAETSYYAKTFGGLRIVGGQSVESKEADKAEFQTNPDAKVITVAIDAGGIGHTLTAARRGIQVEYPWTPGKRHQMCKRLHRIGQEGEVWYTLLIAEGTIDEYKHQTVEGKKKALDAALDGISVEADPDDEQSVVAEVAWALAQRGFGGRA